MTIDELNEILNDRFPKIYWQVLNGTWKEEYEVRGMVKINGLEYWSAMLVHIRYLSDHNFINYIGSRTASQIAKGLLDWKTIGPK